MPDILVYKHRHLFLESEKSKIKVQADVIPGEELIPDGEFFPVTSPGWWGRGGFYKGTDMIYGGSNSTT